MLFGPIPATDEGQNYIHAETIGSGLREKALKDA